MASGFQKMRLVGMALLKASGGIKNAARLADSRSHRSRVAALNLAHLPKLGRSKRQSIEA
jgi:hypothetical protein